MEKQEDMAFDNTSKSGGESIKESNDSKVQAQMAAESQQSTAKDDTAQANQRAADRAEMSKLTGSNFQITDKSNGDQPC
jgi:hypothetical protein